jgi:hypothetical protein
MKTSEYLTFTVDRFINDCVFNYDGILSDWIQKEAITKTMNSLFASVNSSNFKNRKQLAHENNERSCKSIINTFDLLLHTYTKRFFCINTFTKLPIS